MGLSLPVILTVGSFAAVAIIKLVEMGIIPIGGTEKGVYEAPKSPNSWLVSTEFGIDTIRKIDTSMHKTLIYLSHTDDPIETIELGKNAWILHNIGGLAGGKNVIIHLDSSFVSDKLRDVLSNGLRTEQKEYLSRVLTENRRLRRENEQIRRDAKLYLTDITDTIKLMNKNTAAGFVNWQNKKKGGEQG